MGDSSAWSTGQVSGQGAASSQYMRECPSDAQQQPQRAAAAIPKQCPRAAAQPAANRRPRRPSRTLHVSNGLLHVLDAAVGGKVDFNSPARQRLGKDLDAGAGTWQEGAIARATDRPRGVALGGRQASCIPRSCRWALASARKHKQFRPAKSGDHAGMATTWSSGHLSAEVMAGSCLVSQGDKNGAIPRQADSCWGTAQQGRNERSRMAHAGGLSHRQHHGAAVGQVDGHLDRGAGQRAECRVARWCGKPPKQSRRSSHLPVGNQLLPALAWERMPAAQRRTCRATGRRAAHQGAELGCCSS